MKKVLSLILALVLCLPLCACGGASGGTPNTSAPTVPQNVELTKENIKDYLVFRTVYGEKETHKTLGINFTDVETKLEIYSTVAGTFENVNITLKIRCPNHWVVNSSDSAYNKSEDTAMTILVRLPAKGEYSEMHKIGRSYWAAAPESNCYIDIISVSGTFVPSN